MSLINLVTVFTDSLVNPKSMDYTSANWVYPLDSQDLSKVSIGSGNTIKSNIYKTKMIPVSDYYVDNSWTRTDIVIYCHGLTSSISNTVRVLCWKSSWTTASAYEAGVINVVKISDGMGLIDCVASTDGGNAGGIFFLRVNDTFANIQVLVANPCTGVTVYLKNPETTWAKFPSSYIKTAGVLP